MGRSPSPSTRHRVIPYRMTNQHYIPSLCPVFNYVPPRHIRPRGRCSDIPQTMVTATGYRLTPSRAAAVPLSTATIIISTLHLTALCNANDVIFCRVIVELMPTANVYVYALIIAVFQSTRSRTCRMVVKHVEDVQQAVVLKHSTKQL